MKPHKIILSICLFNLFISASPENKENQDKLTTLRTGAQVQTSIADRVFSFLSHHGNIKYNKCMKTKIIISELIQKCYSGNFVLGKQSVQFLLGRGWINENGVIHDSVRQTVIACTDSNNNYKLTNPLP